MVRSFSPHSVALKRGPKFRATPLAPWGPDRGNPQRSHATVAKPAPVLPSHNNVSKLPKLIMSLLTLSLPLAAAGWSLLYLLAGGGIVGAIIIFIIAKVFRR